MGNTISRIFDVAVVEKELQQRAFGKESPGLISSSYDDVWDKTSAKYWASTKQFEDYELLSNTSVHKSSNTLYFHVGDESESRWDWFKVRNAAPFEMGVIHKAAYKESSKYKDDKKLANFLSEKLPGAQIVLKKYYDMDQRRDIIVGYPIDRIACARVSLNARLKTDAHLLFPDVYNKLCMVQVESPERLALLHPFTKGGKEPVREDYKKYQPGRVEARVYTDERTTHESWNPK